MRVAQGDPDLPATASACVSKLPAASWCSSGFQTWVRAESTSVTSASLFFPQLLAQPRGECQPASAAADDNDALHACMPVQGDRDRVREQPLWMQRRKHRQVMTKCTLCVDRIYDEHLPPADRKPACVKACPTGARLFGDVKDPDSEVSKAIRERGGYSLMPEWETQPANQYLPRRITPPAEH